MAKKKKKDSVTPRKSIGSPPKTPQKKRYYLSGLQWAKSPVVRSSSNQLHIQLSPHNSHGITDDNVFLISIRNNSIVGAVVAKIHTSPQSPRKTALPDGKLQISSLSALQILDPSVVDSTEDAEDATNNSFSTPPPKTTNPSTPSSGFSFQSLVHSPPSGKTTTPQSASRLTPRAASKSSLCIVALNSVLGQRLQRQWIRLARTVRFATLHDTPVVTSVVETLVRHTHRGDCWQDDQIIRISYQGKSLELQVKCSGGDLEDDVVEELEHLSLKEEEVLLETDMQELWEAVPKTRIRLYRLVRNTIIQVEDSTQPPEETVAPKVVGMDALVDRLRDRISQATSGGILLHGPSGVGKTALAQQVASSMNHHYVSCVTIAAQTSVVGQAERYLEGLFRTFTVLILDDIHLIGAKRGNAMTDPVTSTLLALMDGATTNNVFVVAITNNPSLLDPALRRPGRLDTELEVPIPDSADTRGAILSVHAHRLSALSGVGIANLFIDWDVLGQLAKGFHGADCVRAVKEAMRTCGGELSREDLVRAIRATKPSAIKSITVEIPKVLWTDVGGMESVKRELREAIEFPLLHPDLFAKLKVPPPRGILLYGPPGCSKTLMARALATEGQMNFLAVKGPELLSKWLGESERALASLFRRARMASPAIIFFDEIDAIASKRGGGDSSSSSRLLSQLLTELDGVVHVSNPKQRVVVVGATNRPDLLDTALTRPGRIDRKIYVGVPDTETRTSIFTISLSKRACSDDIDLAELAGQTSGFSGAECVAICRDAALAALEDHLAKSKGSNVPPCIEMRHLVDTARRTNRQITPDMLDFYASYQN